MKGIEYHQATAGNASIPPFGQSGHLKGVLPSKRASKRSLKALTNLKAPSFADALWSTWRSISSYGKKKAVRVPVIRCWLLRPQAMLEVFIVS